MEEPKLQVTTEEAIAAVTVAPDAQPPAPKVKIHTRNPYEKRLMNDLQGAARQMNYHTAQHALYQQKTRVILMEMQKLGMLDGSH